MRRGHSAPGAHVTGREVDLAPGAQPTLARTRRAQADLDGYHGATTAETLQEAASPQADAVPLEAPEELCAHNAAGSGVPADESRAAACDQRAAGAGRA